MIGEIGFIKHFGDETSRRHVDLGLHFQSNRSLVGALEAVCENVFVFLISGYEASDMYLSGAYFRLLDEAERQRARAFHSEEDRAQFIIAHGLVRLVLSQCVPSQDPASWQFQLNDFGRPEVAGRGGPYFSLSHTKGIIAIAVGTFPLIGVDIERHRSGLPIAELATYFLSSGELSDLQSLFPERRSRRLFEIWTLKEAYAKACGQGLSIPFEQLEFHFLSDRKLGVTFAPDLRDDPARWLLWSLSIGRDASLAIAVADQQCRIRCRFFAGTSIEDAKEFDAEIQFLSGEH